MEEWAGTHKKKQEQMKTMVSGIGFAIKLRMRISSVSANSLIMERIKP